MRTQVRFEVTGSDAPGLYNEALRVMDQVAGGGKWDIWADGPAEEDTSIEDWDIQSVGTKQITRWKQQFKGTVDFE